MTLRPSEGKAFVDKLTLTKCGSSLLRYYVYLINSLVVRFERNGGKAIVADKDRDGLQL